MIDMCWSEMGSHLSRSNFMAHRFSCHIITTKNCGWNLISCLILSIESKLVYRSRCYLQCNCRCLQFVKFEHVVANLGTILDFGMREELVQLIPNIYWLRTIYEIITQWLNLVNLSELYISSIISEVKKVISVV